MVKKIVGKYRLVFIFVGLIALSGCASANLDASAGTVDGSDSDTGEIIQASADSELLIVEDDGTSDFDVEALSGTLEATGAGGLTAAEADGLRFMREEEKLAHDLYIELYEIWGLPIFNNIAQSEATHTASVKALLDKFGIDDPGDGNTAGVFEDETLQALYDQLLAEGSISIEEALRVAALVEEVDIQDLVIRSEGTSEPTILNVYANLTKGSRNHLRAFVSQYESRTGETYSPQSMEAEDVQAILSSPVERGRGRKAN
ncbi:MAG: DUF2202 domain-containing protein [Anaerolineales bacterium]